MLLLKGQLLIEGSKMKLVLLIFLGIFSISYANESYYENGKLVELQNTHSSRSVKDSSINYYKTVTGKKVGVTDKLLVQCKASVNCPNLLDSFNLLNYSKLSNKIFVVKIVNGESVFSVSRALFESKKVVFAHPDFIKERRKR